MKIVLAVLADFVDAFVGRSQLATRIGARSVLAHTLRRAARVEGVARRALVVAPRDEPAAREALAASGCAGDFELLAIDSGRRPRRGLVRSARKWNLSSWRGGLLGTSWFDEYVEPVEAARVLDACGAEGVLCLDGHQPALDAELASRMVSYQRTHADEAEFVFTQAPPGLAGVLLRREVVRRLLEGQAPVGLLLSYRPEAPRMDLITRPMCMRIDAGVAQTAARFRADTQASRTMLERGFAALGEDAGADALCRWLAEGGFDPASELPIEVELELTTDDPLPDTTLRPRGGRVPRRAVADVAAVRRLAEELARLDDRLLWLGGHGDPLLHPQFAAIVRAVREAGVLGVGVATPLVDVSPAAFEALFEAGVDVLEVRVDANSAETYRSVHRADAFETVLANMRRIQQERQARQSPQPVLVPSLTRCAATLAEVEPFFDRWMAQTGWAVIDGYRDCGVLPPDALPGTTPPLRRPCQRLGTRLTLLADGKAVLCSEDPGGRQALGSWLEQDLAALWASPQRAAARRAHGAFEGPPGVRTDAAVVLRALPLCVACGQWHRP